MKVAQSEPGEKGERGSFWAEKTTRAHACGRGDGVSEQLRGESRPNQREGEREAEEAGEGMGPVHTAPYSRWRFWSLS